MRYRIVESDWGKEIIIDDDTKKLQIYYGGNLDLNWQIIDKTADGLINTASITIKEDLLSSYQELQQLFNKLERVKIYDTEEDDEENRLLEYRENNIGNYNSLFPSGGKTIKWISDNDIAASKANYMTITKEEKSFKIEFKTQPNEKGKVEDTGAFDNILNVRIRASGSRYRPFETIFMYMFNNLIDPPKLEESVNTQSPKVPEDPVLKTVLPKKRSIKFIMNFIFFNDKI